MRLPDVHDGQITKLATFVSAWRQMPRSCYNEYVLKFACSMHDHGTVAVAERVQKVGTTHMHVCAPAANSDDVM